MDITLKFPKKELKCSLGLMFLGSFLDYVDMSLDDVGLKVQKNPFMLIPKMIYISASVYAEINGEDFDMTLKDVVDLLESDGGISSPAAVKFINTWTKSMTDGVPDSPKEKGDDSKKK